MSQFQRTYTISLRINSQAGYGVGAKCNLFEVRNFSFEVGNFLLQTPILNPQSLKNELLRLDDGVAEAIAWLSELSGSDRTK